MRRAAVALLVASLTAPLGSEAAAYHEGDAVVVYQPGGLVPETIAAARGVAARRGASVAVFHTGTLGLLRIERGEEPVRVAPAGFRYPLSTMAVDPDRAAPLLGREATAALERGEAVLGRLSAELREAKVGDRLDLLGWDGGTHRLTVGAVVPDGDLGWAEIAFSTEVAAGLGFRRPAYLALWGGPDPEALRADLERILPEEEVGIRTRRDALDPDRVLPDALLKRRFGEFAYRPLGGDRIEIDPAWVEANIVILELPVLGAFRCHRLMALPLERAVEDLIESGFIHHVDPVDFQRSGGCWNPRLIRGGDKGGALSRHAWGAAIDVNPSRNPYGGEVAMNRRIVETFRVWGFAWGGTWVSTDGGHFEWSHVPPLLVGKPSGALLPAGMP